MAKIYRNLADLKLDAAKVPLLAGETVNADQKGAPRASTGSSRNPESRPNGACGVVKGLREPARPPAFHAAGYRELGKRYAEAVLALA